MGKLQNLCRPSAIAASLAIVPAMMTAPWFVAVPVAAQTLTAQTLQNPIAPTLSLPEERQELSPLTTPPRPDLKPLPETTPAPPPKPTLDVPDSNQPPQLPPPSSQATISVKRIEVLGSTVFSQEELAKLVASYENRNLTFEELLEVRTLITRYYTDRGYVTSGAFLPPQDDLATGIIKFQVVEGELERLEIKGLRRLRNSYVQRRLEIAAGKPLNLQKLETALQLLRQNPLLGNVQAELKAGTRPGLSVLAVTLKETPAFHAAALLENRDSPSVGSIRGSFFVNHDNLLGFGDRASAEIGVTSGITDYGFGYTIPLNPQDGTLSLRYQRTTSTIVEAPFSVLDIQSKSQTFSIGFRQPLYRTPSSELALGLALDLRDSETFLFGDTPFSFSPGPDRGVSKVRVLRFSQDWLKRSPSRVLAARSQFSVGLPILGATTNEASIDGKFFSWVGQFQYVQLLSRDVIAIARIATQITPDSMLPLEQFSIGGVESVRSYRQNFRVGDSGVVGSLEVRFPILQQDGGIGTVQLAPFVDIGRVWNNNPALPVPSPRSLVSTGLGLRWQVGNAFSARVDWGIPLIPVIRQGDTFQDYGVVFSIRLQLL